MKLTHLSRIYLRDDEYFELLSPKNIVFQDLLKLARHRGMIFSHRSKEEDVRSELALLPSDWTTVSQIFEDMAKPDPDEKKSTVYLQNCQADTSILDVAKVVQLARTSKTSETYLPTKVSESTVRVEVTYIEPDYSRAVPYQRRERKLFVDIVKNGEQITFRYTANQRAKQIVDLMRAAIKYKDNQPPEVASISLFAVRDAGVRTKFFTTLISDISGYKFDGAAHVDVDIRFPEPEHEDAEEDEAEKERQEQQRQSQSAKVKALINRVALSGEQVLSSDLYQQAIQTGYYISGITWSCISQADARHHLDLEVGFIDPVKADQFTFDVIRQWRYKPERPDTKETVKMTEHERGLYTGVLEEAALRAYKKIVSAPPQPTIAPPQTP